MHNSLFYLPGGLLSQPELNSARLDGLLFEVGAGYMPADIPEGASARAAALIPILSPGFAVSGPSAAWVHGVGDAAPLRHHIQRAVDRRPRLTAAYNVVVHESRLPDADIIIVADVSVTTPQRTLTDLILGASRYPEYVVWMQLLAQQMPTLLPHVHAHLSARPRLPGRRAALTVVERLVAENG